MKAMFRRNALGRTIVAQAIVVAWCTVFVLGNRVLAQQGPQLPATPDAPPAISPAENAKGGPPLPGVLASDPGVTDKRQESKPASTGNAVPPSPSIPPPPPGPFSPVIGGVPGKPRPAPPKVAPFPWVLRVEIVHGKTQLTAETSKGIHIRLMCDQLNLQAPQGMIEAKGGVKLSISGSEAMCERLMITWQDDRVTLEGKVQMKSVRDGMEIRADHLNLRLSAVHMAKESTRVEPRSVPHTAEPPQKDSQKDSLPPLPRATSH
jgi:hypothetical protein